MAWGHSVATFTPELQRLIQIIRYLNSWDQIVLFVFGIWSIFKKQIIRYAVFVKFSKTNIFGPNSLFVATLIYTVAEGIPNAASDQFISFCWYLNNNS